MKKLTKILMPVLSCSALASTIPLGITSCSPTDTKVVGYTIDKDTYMMYGLNAAGERIKLSDEEFKKMEGGFLVALADGSYTYVDRTGHDAQGGVWEKTIQGWMERATTAHAFYYEIWLLGGTYNLNTIDPTKASHINFDIKGVVKYDGSLTSSVYVVPKHPPITDKSPVEGTIDVGNFRNLTFTAVNITGTLHEEQGHGWSVVGAESMSFQYCYFQGLSIFEAEYLDLYRCSLNSDIIEWKAPNYVQSDPATRKFSTTQYALWVKNVNFASFSYCSFLSNGKALKIETKTTNSNPIFVFNSCQFRISNRDNRYIPHEIWPGDDETESDQDKFAVEVNNKSLWGTSYSLYIYWYQIYGDIITDKDPSRPHTYTQHYGEVGSIDEGQWDKNRAVIEYGKLPQ